MNLAFLGDALDHWKGCLFESVRRAHVLHNFAVDPMASDLAAWQPSDFSLLARLLRIDPGQIIPHEKTLGERAEYLSEIRHTGDLFLDPDTGISTGQRPSQQHAAPSEVRDLVADPDRLLCVYQHVRAQRVSDRVDAVCAVLKREIPDCHWSSYESGTVAMLFLSRNSERTSAVSDHFRSLLGRHAAGRIRFSSDGRNV